MKQLSLLLTLLALFTACGRLSRMPEEERMFRKVYKVDLPRDAIYDLALEWLARRLTSSRDAIRMQNKETGKIISKGSGKYSEYFNILVDRKFYYTITIETRDKRYRVTCDNFIVVYDEREDREGPASWKFEVKNIKKKIEPLMNDLFKYISSGEKDDWEKDEVVEKKKSDDKW
jgi:hypothetical protein